MKIKGIIFDMGGTIFDCPGLDFMSGVSKIYPYLNKKNISFDEFYAYALELKKYTIDVRNTYDIKLIDFVNNILDYFEDSVNLSSEEIEDVYLSAFNNELIDGIIPFLEKLKKEGYKLSVLSNTCLSHNAIEKDLKKLGVLKYFDFVLASSDALVRKPSKLFFELGIKKMGLKHDEVIYIGNSFIHDVKGCEDAKIPVMFLNINHIKCETNGKVYEFTSYKDLMELDLCQIF